MRIDFLSSKETTMECDICNDDAVLTAYQDDEPILLCKDCLSSLHRCKNCDTILSDYADHEVLESGKWLCQDCYDENYFTCESCHEVFHIDDQNGDYCQECHYEIYIECHACQDEIRRDSANTNDITDNYYCNSCYNEIFSTCEDCGRDVTREDSWSSYEEMYLCESCYEDRQTDNNTHIHEYGYRPELTFYTISQTLTDDTKEDLFMGIELEVDGDDIDNDNFITEQQELIESMPIYLCHDGSLENGFEIISHPATLEYHKKLEWQKLIKTLRNYKYRSHDYKTCGLHVHINKSYLGSTYEEIDVTLSKILIFYERCWEKIVIFSRRTTEQYKRYANNYGQSTTDDKEIKHLLNTAKRSDRYFAVNLNNHRTIEFRIFRGTLIYKSFIAALEFVHATANFVKEIPLEEHYKINWITFLDYVNKNKYSELWPYMKERELI